MKVAVLISGELRTFEICRPNMTFLDDPRAEVYVSTWDSTRVQSRTLDLNYSVQHDLEHVQRLAGPQTRHVLLESYEHFRDSPLNTKYNVALIYRWLAGARAIFNSGESYDYLLVCRPDLFFHPEAPLRLDMVDGPGLAVAWFTPGILLQDHLLCCSFEDAKRLFSDELLQGWLHAGDTADWHTWWTQFVAEKFHTFRRLGQNRVGMQFCRPIVPRFPTVDDVNAAQWAWRDAQIIDLVDAHGIETQYAVWNPAIVDQAIARRGELEQLRERLKLPELRLGQTSS